jgi:hypothetical protein
MTAEQYRLYLGMLRLLRTYGKGGATWTRTRASGGTPAADPTITQTSGIVIRFMPNNRVVERSALPGLPIFIAPWWGVAAAGVDIQAGDVYDNGSIAFLITGTPDSSQGFLVPPAAPTQVPATIGATQAGYRSPLFILGVSA